MVRITRSPTNTTVNTNIPPPTPTPIQILHFSVKYNWLEISSMNEAKFLTRPSKVDSGSQLMGFFLSNVRLRTKNKCYVYISNRLNTCSNVHIPLSTRQAPFIHIQNSVLQLIGRPVAKPDTGSLKYWSDCRSKNCCWHCFFFNFVCVWITNSRCIRFFCQIYVQTI